MYASGLVGSGMYGDKLFRRQIAGNAQYPVHDVQRYDTQLKRKVRVAKRKVPLVDAQGNALGEYGYVDPHWVFNVPSQRKLDAIARNPWLKVTKKVFSKIGGGRHSMAVASYIYNVMGIKDAGQIHDDDIRDALQAVGPKPAAAPRRRRAPRYPIYLGRQ